MAQDAAIAWLLEASVLALAAYLFGGRRPQHWLLGER